MDTGLIERHLDALLRKPELSEEALLVAALAALEIDPQASHAGFRHWGEASHRVVLIRMVRSWNGALYPMGLGIGGWGAAEFRISGISVRGTPLCPAGHLPLKGGDWQRGGVALPLSPLEGEMSRSDRGGYHNHRPHHHRPRRNHRRLRQFRCARRHTPARIGKSVSVLLNGETFVFLHPDPLSGADAAHGGSGDILAPMTGVVRLVEVKGAMRSRRGTACWSWRR